MEFFEHAHLSIGVDEGLAPPLNLLGHGLALLAKLLFLVTKHDFVSLRRKEALDIDSSRAGRLACRVGQADYFLAEFLLLLLKDLVGVVCLRKLSPALISRRFADPLERCQSEFELGHGC